MGTISVYEYETMKLIRTWAPFDA